LLQLEAVMALRGVAQQHAALLTGCWAQVLTIGRAGAELPLAQGTPPQSPKTQPGVRWLGGAPGSCAVAAKWFGALASCILHVGLPCFLTQPLNACPLCHRATTSFQAAPMVLCLRRRHSRASGYQVTFLMRQLPGSWTGGQEGLQLNQDRRFLPHHPASQQQQQLMSTQQRYTSKTLQRQQLQLLQVQRWQSSGSRWQLSCCGPPFGTAALSCEQRRRLWSPPSRHQRVPRCHQSCCCSCWAGAVPPLLTRSLKYGRQLPRRSGRWQCALRCVRCQEVRTSLQSS
jgi:hypothetical protein